MRYWVFNAEQLSAALAAHEAARQRFGASEQQAKDETLVIASFLASEAADVHGLMRDDGRG